jgi:hypothetical protein
MEESWCQATSKMEETYVQTEMDIGEGIDKET